MDFIFFEFFHSGVSILFLPHFFVSASTKVRLRMSSRGRGEYHGKVNKSFNAKMGAYFLNSVINHLPRFQSCEFVSYLDK